MHRTQAINQVQHSIQVNLVTGQYKPRCLSVWGSVVGAEKHYMALIILKGGAHYRGGYSLYELQYCATTEKPANTGILLSIICKLLILFVYIHIGSNKVIII